MKEIRIGAPQGDVIFRRVDRLPDYLTKLQDAKGDVVVAHSETGHHHVASGVGEYHAHNDGMLAYMLSLPGQDIVVEHQRAWDTHESMRLRNDTDGVVVWEIRRQREHTPKGARRVED